MGPRTGKQIAVAMTERDERDFLAFLRTTADVQLLARASPKPDGVWLDHFQPRRSKDRLSRGFVLWNKAFEWQPEVATDAYCSGVIHTLHASIIEYTRHPFSNPLTSWGRLYWPRGMTPEISGGTNEEFAPWWNEVQRWVKAHSRHREGKGAAVHYLPWAWWRYGKWGLG